MTKFWAFVREFFVWESEEQARDRYLSEASDLADLENRMYRWDRRQRGDNTY